MDTPATKICSKCGISKPLTAFSRSNHNKAGLKPACKACAHVAYKASKSVVAPRQKARRANRTAEQREQDRQYFAQRYMNNRAVLLAEQAKKRAQRTPEEIEHDRQVHAKHYLEHREERQRGQARWRKANPDKRKALEAKRRARKAQAPRNDLSAAQWEEILIAFDHRCAYCPLNCPACKKHTHVLTQEHVTPYDKNGSHTLWNVVPCCQVCNSKKGRQARPLRPVQPLLLTEAAPKPYKPRAK